ncbi:GNAT family N-acetyltransferase [Inhella crocodyli]|uniref:N-acetyltransferase n=1 Tax=Inhella crocodyli TaxID=2499851 RepID=A0A3S2XZZ0_9BURK|nr:GNAT family protein [Inhella crocodyli]RVT88670.1 N-acetyltransferase [Inhella crocodyli]
MSLPTLALPHPGWTLRPWRSTDAEALARAANDDEVLRWMSDTWPEPYTLKDAQWWVDEGQLAMGDNWAICLHDVPQGGCGLSPLDGFQRCNLETGWWLAPAHWGQGVASHAARLMVARGLAQDGITRVFAPIHAGNTRSMGVARRAGMALEGVQRRSAFKRGQVIDRHLYAAVRDDLPNPAP